MIRASLPSPPRSPAARIAPAVMLALLAILATAPAAADWLVTTDGSRIETDGAWSERGKLVVFTDTGGNLVSLRLADVDLESSRRVTAEMQEIRSRPAPSPPPPRPSVFRLTDADVAHVEDEEDGGAAETEAPDDAPPPLVAVVGWEQVDTPSGDGLEIRATLENQGTAVALDITVGVTLFDETGKVLTSTPGRIGANALMPGQATELIAQFPGLYSFTAVDFDIRQRALETRPVEQVPMGEEALAEDEAAGAEVGFGESPGQEGDGFDDELDDLDVQEDPYGDDALDSEESPDDDEEDDGYDGGA